MWDEHNLSLVFDVRGCFRRVRMNLKISYKIASIFKAFLAETEVRLGSLYCLWSALKGAAQDIARRNKVRCMIG